MINTAITAAIIVGTTIELPARAKIELFINGTLAPPYLVFIVQTTTNLFYTVS